MSSALSTAIPSGVSSALASATPSGSSCANVDFTQFPPTSDVACGVGSTSGLASNITDVFDKCCKDAPVEEFKGKCGYYCLSVKQSVADLQSCFMEGGVNPATILCTANNTATATGEPTKSGSPTKSGGAAASGTGGAGEKSAAVVPRGVSKTGLGVIAMVVVSAFAGAML